MGGGGDYHPVKTDPAIERWQNMHTSMYQRFKLTRSNIRPIIALSVLFPAAVYYLSYYTDGIWDMRGTLRDEPFMRTPGLKHNKAAAALDKQKMQERFQQQQEQEE